MVSPCSSCSVSWAHLPDTKGAFSNNVARALDLFLRLGQIDLATTLIGGLAMALIVVLLRTHFRRSRSCWRSPRLHCC